MRGVRERKEVGVCFTINLITAANCDVVLLSSTSQELCLCDGVPC